MTQRKLSYKEKLRQANKEAAASVVALAVIVVAWIALGFGLSGVNVTLFSTPLWVLGGTVGTWLVAIAACVFLAKKVFADFPFEDEEASND